MAGAAGAGVVALGDDDGGGEVAHPIVPTAASPRVTAKKCSRSMRIASVDLAEPGVRSDTFVHGRAQGQRVRALAIALRTLSAERAMKGLRHNVATSLPVVVVS